MPHSSTNEIPFCLSFGTKAVIPVKIEESFPQIALFQSGENREELRENLDLLQEACEVAQIIEYVIKARATKRQGKRLLSWVIEKVRNGAYRLEHLDNKKIP
ncbi:hypothetical protein CR513_39780, partial [Mucuna pruriens]